MRDFALGTINGTLLNISGILCARGYESLSLLLFICSLILVIMVWRRDV